MTRINNMANWMGLSMPNYIAVQGQCNLDKPSLPFNMGVMPEKKPLALSSTKGQHPKEFYDSVSTCALWLFPYHSVGFSKLLDYGLNVDFQDLENNEETNTYPPNWYQGDISLMASIVQYTPRPIYIQELGYKISSQLFGQDELYVAMHWRYDKNDWAVHCDSSKMWKLPPAKQTACKIVIAAIDSPETVAEKVTEWIQSLMRDNIDVKGLYVAAPLDSQPITDAIKQKIKSTLDYFHVATSAESLPIFDQIRPDCPYINENSHDVFSLIDMEICTNSFIFLRSSGSSWSLNVAQDRHVRGIDAEDFENMSVMGVKGEGFDEEE